MRAAPYALFLYEEWRQTLNYYYHRSECGAQLEEERCRRQGDGDNTCSHTLMTAR